MVTKRDERAIPKVIDFGGSKALSQKLTDKSIYAADCQMIGTTVQNGIRGHTGDAGNRSGCRSSVNGAGPVRRSADGLSS